jgi:hypothetical protein
MAALLKDRKDKSTERIDGIVALIMAIGRAMVAQKEPQPGVLAVFCVKGKQCQTRLTRRATPSGWSTNSSLAG